MFPSADRVWRRLVEAKKLPTKDRIAALNKIARPSLSLLRRLLHPSNPAKLRLAAARIYELAMIRRELAKKAKTKKDANVQPQ
jgi:hypothetical protein